MLQKTLAHFALATCLTLALTGSFPAQKVEVEALAVSGSQVPAPPIDGGPAMDPDG